MSLLLFSNPLTSLPSLSSSSSPCSSSTLFLTASPVSRLQTKHIDLQSTPLKRILQWNAISSKRTSRVIVKASSAIDGTPPADNNEPPTEKKEEAVMPVDKLPLESKLQERMEQKMRMKLAKKIRLRRKRLVRKRRLRKKGRWPPSKMKKLKNV